MISPLAFDARGIHQGLVKPADAASRVGPAQNLEASPSPRAPGPEPARNRARRSLPPPPTSKLTMGCPGKADANLFSSSAGRSWPRSMSANRTATDSWVMKWASPKFKYNGRGMNQFVALYQVVMKNMKIVIGSLPFMSKTFNKVCGNFFDNWVLNRVGKLEFGDFGRK